MADTEVVNILREIRERVRAEHRSEQEALAPRAPAAATEDALASDPIAAAAALARMEANLQTTERAKTRFPPLLSYRQGWSARLELWLKRQIKRATHWFTWEQVNFNVATHQALRDALEALAAYEQHVAELRQRLDAAERAQAESATRWAETTAQVSATAASLNSLAASLNSLEHRLRAFEQELAARLTSERQEQQAEAERLRDEFAALLEQFRAELRGMQDAQRESNERLREQQSRSEQLLLEQQSRNEQLLLEQQSRSEQLLLEQQSRHEQLLLAKLSEEQARNEQLLLAKLSEQAENIEFVRDEQRVSYKQLAREVSESAVTADRSRRDLLRRMDELAAQLEEARRLAESGAERNAPGARRRSVS